MILEEFDYKQTNKQTNKRTNLEEVNLHCSIGEVHDHSTRGSEPGLEGRNPRIEEIMK